MPAINLNIPYMALNAKPKLIKKIKKLDEQFVRCRKSGDVYGQMIALDGINVALQREAVTLLNEGAKKRIEFSINQASRNMEFIAKESNYSRDEMLSIAHNNLAVNKSVRKADGIDLKEKWLEKQSSHATQSLQNLASNYRNSRIQLNQLIENTGDIKEQIKFLNQMNQLGNAARQCLADPLVPEKYYKKLWGIVERASKNTEMAYDAFPKLDAFKKRQAVMHRARDAGHFKMENPQRVVMLSKLLSITENDLFEHFQSKFSEFKDSGMKVECLYSGNNPLYKFSLISDAVKNKDDSTFVVRRANIHDGNDETRERLAGTPAEKHIAKLYLKRPLEYENKTKGKVYAYMEAVECLAGGSLQSLADNNASKHPIEKQQVAIKYLKDMVGLVKDLSEQNIFFPDLKLNNFLMDETGRLRVADIKSFVCHDGEERLKISSATATEAYLPPEYAGQDAKHYYPEEMQAYMTGLAIYELATGHQVALDGRKPDGSHQLDFSNDVFKGENGQHLQTLVEGLTEKNVNKRLSLSGVAKQLDQFKKVALDVDLDQRLSRAP